MVAIRTAGSPHKQPQKPQFRKPGEEFREWPEVAQARGGLLPWQLEQGSQTIEEGLQSNLMENVSGFSAQKMPAVQIPPFIDAFQIRFDNTTEFFVQVWKDRTFDIQAFLLEKAKELCPKVPVEELDLFGKHCPIDWDEGTLTLIHQALKQADPGRLLMLLKLHARNPDSFVKSLSGQFVTIIPPSDETLGKRIERIAQKPEWVEAMGGENIVTTIRSLFADLPAAVKALGKIKLPT